MKQLIFHSFKFHGLKNPNNIPDGEIKLKFFHDVNNKDPLLEVNFRKTPKLTTKILHPRNCKQNVPTSLAIFHETTAAAIQPYFQDQKNTVEFLKLFGK